MKWPGSDIAFSQVREDPLVEHQVVERVFHCKKEPLDVLLIGSGGCTALGLLNLPQVGTVNCIDANPAQIQLIKLRNVAIRHLSKEDVLLCLGINGSAEEHLSAFDKLCSHLSVEDLEYWQKNLSLIAFGVNRVGKFEELFRELVRVCKEHIGFLAIDDPEKAVNHKNWQRCFDIVFEREKLAKLFGRAAVDYSMSKSFADHFSHVFAKALLRYPKRSNYFVDQIWLENYSSEENGFPPYLMSKSSNDTRLQLRCGTFLSQLSDIGKKWDIIQTSNISDWMPIVEMKKMFASVKNHLYENGAIITRRLNGDHVLSDVVGSTFYTDNDFNRHLWETDRSYFYSEVVVGFANE
ncbi:DUF3419 family protein [Candidatus Uabimicrobium sp. HlEnr_7]|uniref:DUF3419 family protein n=1 Tax=Candidatus Uabimicrobium helgolandensis TaxID=3095367 RepID=UPI003558A482